jgi:hypothetical protein
MTLKKSDIVTAIAAETDETFVIGAAYFIRTITYHIMGRLSRVSTFGGQTWLHLTEASYIAVGARFNEMINSGKLDETEHVHVPITVNSASIVDVYPWNHPLPTKST